MKNKDEEHEQILVMNWLHINQPEIWEVTHHSPNGGLRNKVVAAKLKLMGVKRGFPDLVIFYPVGDFVGLVIEMKVGGRKATPYQKFWLNILERLGFSCHVCQGSSEAIKTIGNYLEGGIDG